MKIEGKLYVKMNTEQVKETFRKREFVVEYAENPLYPQFVKFELIQDNVALIDNFEPGQMIEVDFNLRGREWTNPQGERKYFNTLAAWRIQRAAAEGGAEGNQPPNNVYSAAEMESEGADDLPF